MTVPPSICDKGHACRLSYDCAWGGVDCECGRIGYLGERDGEPALFNTPNSERQPDMPSPPPLDSREDGSMKITDEIRKAGLKARDELLERMFDGGTVDNDLADRMESIIDACVRAALTTAPAVDAEPIGHIPKEQIADLESGGCAFVVRLMSMEGVENEYVPVYLATPAVAAEPSSLSLLDERDRLLAANEGMRKALEFYANPNNWVDTPSWDGDPSCITPKGVPVVDTMTGECDCGETARAALSPALINSKPAPAGEGEVPNVC